MLDNGRKVSKLDISVLLENSMVAKAIMSNQLMERNQGMNYKELLKKSSPD